MELTLKKFKELNLNYRKEKNTLGSNLTSVLLGEVQNSMKKSSKDEKDLIISFLTKLQKSLKESNSEESKNELNLVNSWLPTLMSKEEILDFIKQNFKEEDFSNKGRFTDIVVGKLKGKALGKDISAIIQTL